MKLVRLIMFGLFLSTGFLNAQNDFRPGYIIKTTGDTLYGEIDYRGDLLMSSICKFKSIDNAINKYSPNDIIAFRFIDSKLYISKNVKSRRIFLEYLIKGNISIYYMRDKNGDHYFMDKEGENLIEIPYKEEIISVDNKQVLYESKQHIGILKLYMQDDPNIQSKIYSIKKPDHQSLIKLVKDYHNDVCEGEKCIIYERKQPFIKVNLEVLGGVVNFENVEDLIDKFYFQGGIICHLWMPRTNEKLYFRTGLLYSQLEAVEGKSNIYKIPFHLEYIYPKGSVRPRLSYGINFYDTIFQTVSFNIGTNIKLNNSFYLSATSDIEFIPLIMIFPHDLLSYSLNFGITYLL